MEGNMRVHDYVITIPDGKDVYLYNTYNCSLISIEKECFDNGELINLTQEEVDTLNDFDFFKDENEILKEIYIRRSNDRRLLDVTISFTQSCMLNCSYCSQEDSRDKVGIAYSVLDDLVEYISNVLKNEHYERLGINLFGGEPLIEKDKILYFKNELEKCIDSSIISYGIGTNGVLLTPDFLKKFNQLNICVTLSLKNDHDKNRAFIDGSGSYERIVSNLISCNDQFGDAKKLNIRYNVGGNNYNDFETFLSLLKELNLNVNNIELAYTEEFDYTGYTNGLNKDEYSDWYINKAIDLLIKYGYRIWFPTPCLYTCKAYNPHALKVFPDGCIAACNGQKYKNRKESISLVKNNISLTKEILADAKKDLLITEECKRCKYLLVCGGKYLCKKDDCTNFIDYSLEDFLKKYIRLTEEGKADCFDL